MATLLDLPDSLRLPPSSLLLPPHPSSSPSPPLPTTHCLCAHIPLSSVPEPRTHMPSRPCCPASTSMPDCGSGVQLSLVPPHQALSSAFCDCSLCIKLSVPLTTSGMTASPIQGSWEHCVSVSLRSMVPRAPEAPLLLISLKLYTHRTCIRGLWPQRLNERWTGCSAAWHVREGPLSVPC